LVVWNMFFSIKSLEWNNHPNWLSVHHFSEGSGEKPPTSHIINHH
jgi:hypothetical protein